MEKTNFLLFSFLIPGLLSCGQKEKDESKNSFNVLFIAIDDLNDWVGCMNSHLNARTPNIDRLSDQGVLFTNAHCQAPLCGPSRASLMTGLRPSTTGIYGQIDDNDIRKDNPVTEDLTLLPEYFSQNGYHTMGIGKLFHHHAPDGVFDESGGRVPGFGPKPEERFVWPGLDGKDFNNDYGGTSTDWGAYPEADSLMPDYQSARWAIERLNRDYDRPFFLAVGFLRPHVPWYVPQKWFDMHPLEDIETPPYSENDLEDLPDIALEMDNLPMMPTTEWVIENNEWRKAVQAYLACISFVDHYVGEILDALENSKYSENTIVVLWSDHGYRLGEKHTFAKHCLWEEATNVPLIFAGPGIKEGKSVSSPVELLSIYPTLLDLCGLKPYPRNQGTSLAPVLTGENSSVQEYAMTTYGWGNHGIRTENFRYIQYNNGAEEFYDHTKDPNEWDNLIKQEDVKDEINRMKKFLPDTNVPYAKHSYYNYNPYFRIDKIIHSKPDQ